MNFNIPMRKRHPDLFHRTIVCYNPHKRRPNSEAQIIKKEFDYAFPKISPILLFEKWSELAAVLVILVALVNLLESIFIIIVGTALVLVFRNNEKSRIIISVF